MNALIQSILEFSQIDKIGKKDQEVVDLNKVIGAATMNLEVLIKEKNAFFEILKNKADKDSQLFVRSNATQALSAFKTKESEDFLELF